MQLDASSTQRWFLFVLIRGKTRWRRSGLSNRGSRPCLFTVKSLSNSIKWLQWKNLVGKFKLNYEPITMPAVFRRWQHKTILHYRVSTAVTSMRSIGNSKHYCLFLIIHSSQVFEGVLYCDLVRQRVQIMEVTVFQKNDLVTSRPLKDSTSITSGPLSTIFNASIIQDFYPNCWKKGRVTSAFKKWYRNWQPNCIL